ncbi:hypothetical protein HDU78_011142 [Chytriomyces hyalinus]|nr:hypothetical protein HDU78_011142 [Chytriomyces hyalinus]
MRTLHKLYYEDKLMKTQKEFLEWTKANLGFSKSTTYEYIISYRVYMEIANKIPKDAHPPMYQSHCQLLSKVPAKKLVDTWMDVCKQAPGGIITTAFLETYLEKNNLKGGKAGRISMQVSEPAPDAEEESTPDPNAVIHASDSASLVASGSNSSNPLQNNPTNNTLPFNEHLIFELSKQVVLGSQFDMVLQSVEDFQGAEHKMWGGSVWANLASVRPLTTRDIYSAPPPLADAAVFEGGLEHLLRIVFTKFAGKEFAEGIFLLRAEFGADWFSPIMQHPFCILRHTNVPAPIEIPISTHPEASLQEAGSNASEVSTTTNTTTANAAKRQKRGSAADGTAASSASSSSLHRGGSGTLSATACVQPPFESFILFYLGPNVKEFCTVFRSVALVPGINSWCAVVAAPGVALPVGSE